jgi:hypothetical protein
MENFTLNDFIEKEGNNSERIYILNKDCKIFNKIYKSLKIVIKKNMEYVPTFT